MNSDNISEEMTQVPFKWHTHYEKEADHAFLSPSKHSWVRYDMEKLLTVWENDRAKEKGTRLHQFASDAINLGIRLEPTGQTINMFVNDVIGYGMKSELKLRASDYCYGTADAISFDGKNLKIFDLKTGFTPASMEQLRIYAAIFCLEYNYIPSRLNIELRIYQSDEVIIEEPDPGEIKVIMRLIRQFTKALDKERRKENE